WLDARRPLPPHVAYLEARYANEPYRLALALMAADLEIASREDMTARLLEDEPHRARVDVDELRTMLDVIADALPPVLADDSLRAMRSQIAIFGLHAAHLDIREDSARLSVALGGMLRALGIDEDFARRTDEERTACLVRSLSDEPPKLADLTTAAMGEE